MVVGRLVRVGLELLVADRDAQAVAEALEVLQRHLLHLVRRVATGEVRAEAVALDRLGEDDGRLPRVLAGGLVGGEDLAVVVPAALEVPVDLVVAPPLDHLEGARVATEEVVTDVLAVVGAEGLVVAVARLVHDVHERAVAVGGEQGVPPAAPDDLDDVPAGAAEERLELLDDLAVAAHRAVEPLQVAVDDEVEVVELLVGRELQQAARLRLVHLAVAEEGPDVLLARVLDAAVVEVLVELRLVDGVHRADAHRHRRELPVVGQQPRVRVGRHGLDRPVDDVALLLAEAVELVLGEVALEEAAGVHAGGGVALEVDLVAAALVVLAAEEVVHAHLVERRGGRVRRDVPADADAGTLSAVHHDRGVPADVAAHLALDVLVAGEPRLALRRDRVDVVGRGQGRDPHLLLARPLDELEHDVARPRPTLLVEDGVERVDPLLRLVRIDVRELTGDAVEDRSGLGCHVGSFLVASQPPATGRPRRCATILHQSVPTVTVGSRPGTSNGVCRPCRGRVAWALLALEAQTRCTWRSSDTQSGPARDREDR